MLSGHEIFHNFQCFDREVYGYGGDFEDKLAFFSLAAFNHIMVVTDDDICSFLMSVWR